MTSNRGRLRGLALCIGIIAGGCYVTTTATPPMATVEVQTAPPPTVDATVTIQAGQPQLASGVTIIESACMQGAQEVCNGLDDNCNGMIDEGCGYSSGNVQITLAWNTGADIDMYVTDPQGNEISYQNQSSPTGGQLDHDARGTCNASQENNRIENVYWPSNPPSGNYSVDLHYWANNPCSSQNGPTQTTLSISVGGRVIGAYNYVLSPNQRITLASFNIP